MQSPASHDNRWPALGDKIGPWLLDRHYDLEGSGEMFVARRADGAFDREVLITFLRMDAGNLQARSLFDLEVELQAQLDHAGIAKVYGAGRTEGGIPYMVTEYLPGADIEHHLDKKKASIPDRIHLFLLVCDAVQHAHEQGIVGLHLQAENIHLVPDGTIRLVVYGLAHTNGPEASAMPWPQYAVDYASPEEWASRPISEASDVYSLGVLLYLLLTGMLPKNLDGLTPAEAEDLVHREWHPTASAHIKSQGKLSHAERRRLSVRQLASQLSGDLDHVLARAMAREPEQRYASAKDLAEDLTRHLAGQPIKAGRPSTIYTVFRGLKRHRAALLVSLAVLGSLTWALGKSIASAQRAELALEEAQQSEQEAAYQSGRLQELCVRFMTELGPSMQGRKGLEGARRYLLNAGAPLLDHLRAAGQEDRRLHNHLARSYLQLAEADFVARDQSTSVGIPDSVKKARQFTQTYFQNAPQEKPQEGMVPWARAIRCAIWFAELTLDQEAGDRILAEAEQELKAQGIPEEEISAYTVFYLMETKRNWYSHLLRYEDALANWDNEVIDEIGKRNPDMVPFLLGDRPRWDSYRARLLIRSGRVREALLVLPPIVYLIQEETSRHSPPLTDLVALETNTWLLLALARAYSGVPTGEALVQAKRSIEWMTTHFEGEPGVTEDLAGAGRWLGECLFEMGPEHWEEAAQATEASIQHWQTILRRKARWPLYSTNLSRTFIQAAKIAIARDRIDEAQRSLREADRLLRDLPDHARKHPHTRWVRAQVDLLSKTIQPERESPSWGQVEASLRAVRTSNIHPHLLAALEASWLSLVTNHHPDPSRLEDPSEQQESPK